MTGMTGASIHTTMRADPDEIGREIFIRDLIGNGTPHFAVRAWRTKWEPRRAVTAAAPVRDILFSLDAPGARVLIAEVTTARGGVVRLMAEKSGRGGWLTVWAASADRVALRGVLARLGKLIPVTPEKPAEELDESVTVRFVHRDQYGGPSVMARDIEAPKWEQIARNYAPSARDALAGLLPAKLDDLSGHFAVVHGPPGTGKTTYLRALMQAWRGQASFWYVMDAERFFGDPAYMTSVLFSATSREWNVLLVEDAEEFIAPGAKAQVGQALSRLLNLGDGLLGQGLKHLFVFTTNAPDQELHPAMIRPGRCFAKIEVPLFTAAEAGDWLGGPADGEMSLAELYERKAIPEK